MDYIYSLDFEVRDYECDLQGIVNNAVYQNYLEHTRHKFLLHLGFDFAQWHDEGKDAVVVKTVLEYKSSLRSADEFEVKVKLVQNGALKVDFIQDVYRKKDNFLCLKARVTSVIMENNRPLRNTIFFDEVDNKNISYIKE